MFLTFQMPSNETGSFVVKLNIDFEHRCHVMQSERYDFFKAVAFTLKITLFGLMHIALNAHSCFKSLCKCALHLFNSQTARLSIVTSWELDPSSWRVLREIGNLNTLGTIVRSFKLLKLLQLSFPFLHYLVLSKQQPTLSASIHPLPKYIRIHSKPNQ